MGLFDITQIALERALAGSTARQQALANNIANANTPGFKRSDVDFQTSLASALDGGATADQLQQLTFQPQVDNQSSLQVDGNNVDIDQEMANLSANTVTYQALVAVDRSRLQMLSTAIGTG